MAYSVNDKAEAAAVALLTPVVGPLAVVVTGKNSGDKSLPIVICAADGEGEEDPKGTGNVFVDLIVSVKSTGVPNETGGAPAGPDPKIADQALVSLVFGALQVTDLDAQLTAAGNNFTVFPNGVFFNAPKSGRDANGVWVDELHLRVYCCSSAIAA